jgi:hypothetical protein
MTLSSNVNDLAARIATEFNTLRSEAGPTPVTISDTAPTDSSAFWYNSTNGILYIKYDGFWVEATPAVEGPTGPQGDAGAPGDPGVVAQADAPSNTDVLWLDTDDTADILELREVYPHPFMLAFS